LGLQVAACGADEQGRCSRLAETEKALFLPDGSRNPSYQVRSQYEATYQDCMEYMWSPSRYFANVQYVEPEHSVGDFLRTFQNNDHVVYKDGTHWISIRDLQRQIANYHRKVMDRLSTWSRDVRYLGYRALTPDDDVAMLAREEAKRTTRARIERAIMSKYYYHSQEEQLRFAHQPQGTAQELRARLRRAVAPQNDDDQ
jgi:hypothetical protein